MYTCYGNQVVETSERIDIEKLKAPEKIHFFDEIILYEDELHDNGCAVLNVKVVCNSVILNMRLISSSVITHCSV